MKPCFGILPLSLLIALFLGLASGEAFATEAPSPSCTPFMPNEQPLERDYQILTSKNDILQNLNEVYQGAPRLKGRAFWEATQNSFVVPYGGGLAKVPQRFIKGLAAHFTMALKNQYVDAIIYPDMGHAHLLAPIAEWAEIKRTTPEPTLRMEKLLALPNLKALYHTAEMMQIKEGDFVSGKLPQDPWKLWRYFSRNLLGIFAEPSTVEVIWAGPSQIYNTVREVPGFLEVSTLYFSSNHGACFEFANKEGPQFFDFTFDSIPYKQPVSK